MGIFRSWKSGDSAAFTRADRQTICRGCQRLEAQLERYLARPRDATARLRYARVLAFHADFRELDDCARLSKCATCVLFRQALLLNRPTSAAAEELAAATPGRAVFASFDVPPEGRSGLAAAGALMQQQPARPGIVVEIPGEGGLVESVRITCAITQISYPLNLPREPRNDGVLQQVKQWIGECDRDHVGYCSNLRWSSRTPTRLVHVSNDGLRLVQPAQDARSLRYVILSYSWGTQYLSKDEEDIIETSKTKESNVMRRFHNLNPDELPATIRDAIILTKQIGLSYIWIDSLCIVQDSSSDWLSESPRMHEYYGNAYFTLCVSSNIKATEPLLCPRAAWSIQTKPCRLSGQWLTPTTTLSDIRASSPLAQRAWTLQEERLSPRILHWTPQRLYWSCSRSERAEQQQQQSAGLPLAIASDSPPPPDYSQSFLVHTTGGGPAHVVHAQWQALLESFTRRRLTQQADTFAAIAGLAARYLHAAASTEEYVAGLWRNTFAADLAWSVLRPADARQKVDVGGAGKGVGGVPSWSWASLPQETPTSMVATCAPARDFALLKIGEPEEKSARHARSEKGMPGDGDAQAMDETSRRIVRGQTVKRVCVRGRLRPFWPAHAVAQPWSSVARPLRGGGEAFSFAEQPEQPVFAAEVAGARVLSYEARRKEVLGQLDYAAHAARVANADTLLWALEVGTEAMLLLEKLGFEFAEYRRVGLARRYRANFFEDSKVQELWLV